MSSGRLLIYRTAAPFCALLMFLLLTGLYGTGQSGLYEAILHDWGILPFPFPFLDISGSLSAWDCARLGVDVVIADPCDVLHRTYNYSPLWMSLAWIPLGVDDRDIVGVCLDLLFIASLCALPAPRRPIELAIVLTATLSTMVVFALERAQPDILMFLMAVAIGYIAQSGPRARLLAYGVALLAALIKYYPIMFLVILWRERPGRFLRIGTAIVGLLILFGAVYHVDLARGIPTIPGGPYIMDWFGSKNLPFLLGDLVQEAAQAPLAGRLAALTVYLALAGGGIAICLHMLRDSEWDRAFAALDRFEAIFLVIGSATVFGCFFAGQNLGYRGVFLLLIVPGMLGIARNAVGRLRRVALWTSGGVALLMWGECLRRGLARLLEYAAVPDSLAAGPQFLFWLTRELGWWWIVSVMVAVLIHYLRHSPAVEGLAWPPGRLLTRS